MDSKYVDSFVQARWFTKGPRKNRVDWVVIHDMEAPEKALTAENVARYFQTTDRKASAHFNVDADSIVQSVREADIAYHAKGANARGIGIEHAGYARQSRDEWLDEYGRKMLARSARLVRDICDRYGIPIVLLSAADLQAGRRGLTSHAAVSTAFPGTGHMDPGPSFPWNYYLNLIKGDDDNMPDKTEVKDAMVDALRESGVTQSLAAIAQSLKDLTPTFDRIHDDVDREADKIVGKD